MKVTNQELVNSIKALREIQEIEAPFKLSYQIAKLIKQIDPLLKAYEETRQKVANKFVKKDENGNSKTIKQKVPNQNGEVQEIEILDIDYNDPEFIQATNDISEFENEINMQQILASAFENIDIKPTTLIPLMWLIKEDQEEQQPIQK